jgi:hypothetical protein
VIEHFTSQYFSLRNIFGMLKVIDLQAKNKLQSIPEMIEKEKSKCRSEMLKNKRIYNWEGTLKIDPSKMEQMNDENKLFLYLTKRVEHDLLLE